MKKMYVNETVCESSRHLLQYITEGTRETKNGGMNILEVIFTNNHELITNIHIQPSEITGHKYVVCETSYKLPINDMQYISEKMKIYPHIIMRQPTGKILRPV